MNELGSSAGERSSLREVPPSYSEGEVASSEVNVNLRGASLEAEGRLDVPHDEQRVDVEDWSDEELEAEYESRGKDSVASEADAGSAAVESRGLDGADVGIPRWSRIEGEHSIEADAEAVNPHFGPDCADEWKNNCQSCAAAYEMRRRGYNVEAKPFSADNEYLARSPEAAWSDAEIQTTEGNGKADIESKMQEWGDGSRAEVVVFWKEGGGHAFCAEQVDGKTRFIDPQVASDSESAGLDAGDYFSYVRDDGSTYFWRTDTATPSSGMEDCCKEAER